MKKIATAIVLLILMIFPVSSFASDKPVVKMANEVYTISKGFNNIPLDDTTKKNIWNMIYTKLNELQAKGDLPFELSADPVPVLRDKEEMAGEGDPYLIPTVVVNSTKDTWYMATTNTYYNASVTSGISLVFCMREENDEIEKVTDKGNTVTLKMLGIVPLVKSDIIGTDANDKRTELISEDEKIRKFLYLTRESLDKQLKFSSSMKNLKDEYALQKDETYQVTDVKISSKKAQELFFGQDGEDLKFLVAYNFTSGFQQRSKGLVYLPAFTSNSFGENVAGATNSVSLDSYSGTINLAMSHPRYKVSLDITGANYAYSDANKVMAYKVWLARDINGNGKVELERGWGRPLLNASYNQIDYAAVLRRMFQGLAFELGDKKM